MTERSFRCRLPNQPFVHLIGEITYKIPTTSNHQFRENRHPLHSNTNPVLSPHFHLFIWPRGVFKFGRVGLKNIALQIDCPKMGN